MGKGTSQKQTVTEYRMSVHFGVCLSADAITGLWVNEKEAWIGDSTTHEVISISQPNLFGGVEKEGGLVGDLIHMPGRDNQVLRDDFAARLGPGRTGANTPAYRQKTTIAFVGSGVGNGFNWSYNNPVIATTVWVRVRRAPKTDLTQTWVMIGPNANPAHVIFECLTDTDWGMGSPRPTIDHTSFNAAAHTLFDEGFGISMQWTRQTAIEDFISEIIDHIQATLYLHPRTGLWTLKLIRDDYDVETLRHLTVDNAELDGFSRRMWGEAINEITVTYTNPVNEQEETITYQDLANVSVQGAVVSQGRNYYGVRDAGLAAKLAQRDVRSSAAPLASGSATVNREQWDVTPGEVMLLTYPEKDLYSIVVRAMNVDYGSPSDSTIKLSLLEDIFSLEKPPLVVPPTSAHDSEGTPPEPMAATEIITLPAYMTASGDFQTNAVDLEFPEVLAAVLAYQDKPDTHSYNLLSSDVISTGATRFVSHGFKTVLERTVLPATLPVEITSRLQNAIIINKQRGPEVGSFVFFGALNDSQMELALVTDFDEGTAEWILARGVLDTVPRSWPIGTPVWFLNRGDRIVDDRTLRAAGEVVNFKLLTRAPGGVLPIEDAPTVTETMGFRPHLPLRPANVKVNGTAFGSINAGPAEFLITWSTRNRMLEDGLVLRWDDGPVAPEHAQGTVIDVFDQNNNNVYHEFGLWTELEAVYQASWFARYSSIKIRVSAAREDLESLQAHTITVTGLPADPNAPPPPTPPDHGPPPNVDPAPAEGAWTATGFMFQLDQAGKVISGLPAILVSGQRDRPTAIGLIVRYKKTGTNDWFYLGEVALTDEPTQSATTAVSAQTAYIVEVAYRSDKNVLSMWRNLGEVTTGTVIAGQVGEILASEIKDALDFLAQIDEEALAALGDLSTLTSSMNLTAESILAHITRSVEDHDRFNALTHQIDDTTGQPVPIGTALRTERDNRILDGAAYNQIFTALGAWNGPDHSAWILNGQSTFVTPDQSFAEYTQAQVVQFGQVYSTIQATQTTLANATQAVANELHALGVGINNNTAFAIDETKLITTSQQSLGQRLTGLQSYTDTSSANVLQQAKAYSDTTGGAFASVLTTLGLTSGQFAARITEYKTVDTAYGAKAGLRLDVQGHVTGFLALNDGLQGGFVFVADYFAITTPSGNITPFIVFQGAVHMTDVIVHTLAAGSISAVHIIAGEIYGDRIRGGAVSQVEALQSNAGGATLSVGNQQTLHTQHFTCEGGKITIAVNARTIQTGNGVSGINCVIANRQTGAVLDECAVVFPGPFQLNISFTVFDNPGPGAFDYDVKFERTPGSQSANSNGVNTIRTIITELKK